MKLPFDLGIKLVFRLLVPGLFLALALLPVINTVLEFGGWASKFEYVFVLVVIFIGWLVIVSDMPLYMLFEGRRFWPERLWVYFVSRGGKRVRDLQGRLNAYRRESEDTGLPEVKRERAKRKMLETYVELRRYPVAGDTEKRRGKQVDYVSRFPTRLGNILEAYENTPERLYGTPSVFYWWRIWLTLDKDLREEIDNRQAIVDSTVYTSFAFYFNGAAWACYGLMLWLDTLAGRFEFLRLPPSKVSLFTHLPAWWVLPILSAVSFLAGYMIYRTALHLHVQFGEVYMSVYDLRRGNVKPEEVAAGTLLSEQPYFAAMTPWEKNWAVWRYLQYNLIECPRCGTPVSAEKLDDPCDEHKSPAV